MRHVTKVYCALYSGGICELGRIPEWLMETGNVIIEFSAYDKIISNDFVPGTAEVKRRDTLNNND
jgi:hypothetical protein